MRLHRSHRQFGLFQNRSGPTNSTPQKVAPMKLHQPLLSVAAAVVLALTVTGCGGNAQAGDQTAGQAEVKELRYQGSANNVGLPELASDLGYLGDIKLNWVGNTTSGPQD